MKYKPFTAVQKTALIRELNNLKIKELIGSGSKRSLAAVIKRLDNEGLNSLETLVTALKAASERFAIAQDKKPVQDFVRELEVATKPVKATNTVRNVKGVGKVAVVTVDADRKPLDGFDDLKVDIGYVPAKRSLSRAAKQYAEGTIDQATFYSKLEDIAGKTGGPSARRIRKFIKQYPPAETATAAATPVQVPDTKDPWALPAKKATRTRKVVTPVSAVVNASRIVMETARGMAEGDTDTPSEVLQLFQTIIDAQVQLKAMLDK